MTRWRYIGHMMHVLNSSMNEFIYIYIYVVKKEGMHLCKMIILLRKPAGNVISQCYNVSAAAWWVTPSVYLKFAN